MPHSLLDTESIAESPLDFLRSIGDVFAVFDAATQDSGNVSYGVLAEGERYFVKSAGSPEAQCFLPFDERVALLRNAIKFARDVEHPALAKLLHVIESSPNGPLLVYEWVNGDLLNARSQSAHQRFRALPAAEIAAALDTVIDLHAVAAERGWIVVDLYDGCLIYDFDARTMRLIDLDMYGRGKFVNTMGTMFGSSRFMAPEEFTLGADIDQRTTVFTLGRFVAELLSNGTLDAAPYRGDNSMMTAMRQACHPGSADRFQTVAGFSAAWRSAIKTA